MLAVILGVLLVLAVLAALAWALRNRVEAESAKERVLQRGETPALVYLVPPGQDPAVLVSALGQRGYDASADVVGGPQRLLLARHDGRTDREEVRAVIEAAGSTSLEGETPAVRGPVRFADEEASR